AEARLAQKAVVARDFLVVVGARREHLQRDGTVQQEIVRAPHGGDGAAADDALEAITPRHDDTDADRSDTGLRALELEVDVERIGAERRGHARSCSQAPCRRTKAERRVRTDDAARPAEALCDVRFRPSSWAHARRRRTSSATAR